MASICYLAVYATMISCCAWQSHGAVPAPGSKTVSVPTFGFPTGGWTAPDNASDAATWLADSNKTSPFAIAAQIGQLDTDVVDAWLNNLKNVTSDTTGNVRFSNHKCSGGSTSSRKYVHLPAHDTSPGFSPPRLDLRLTYLTAVRRTLSRACADPG